jgi:hypothetical protein
MDLHLRAVLPVSISWSVGSVGGAGVGPTTCEQLRRVAVGGADAEANQPSHG